MYTDIYKIDNFIISSIVYLYLIATRVQFKTIPDRCNITIMLTKYYNIIWLFFRPYFVTQTVVVQLNVYYNIIYRRFIYLRQLTI